MRCFTAEENNWIKEHYWDAQPKELCEQFNRVFEPRDQNTFRHHCVKIGLTRRYTAEQDTWIKANIDKYSRKELVAKFNDVFHQRRTEDVLKVHCNRDLGLRFSDNRERYINAKRGERQPTGTLIRRKNRQWVVKTGVHQYEQAGRYYWEQEYGEIPKGFNIVHLDHDISNNKLDNLYMVSGKVNREMSKNKWWFKDPLLTLTAIKYCELHFLLKDAKGGKA